MRIQNGVNELYVYCDILTKNDHLYKTLREADQRKGQKYKVGWPLSQTNVDKLMTPLLSSYFHFQVCFCLLVDTDYFLKCHFLFLFQAGPICQK